MNEFLQQLKELHTRNGSLSTRDISMNAMLMGNRVSHATISEALSGKRTPEWRTMHKIILAMGGDPTEFLTLYTADHQARKAEERRHKFTRVPEDVRKQCVLDGQICAWDDGPEWEFGQVWIPVCARCGNGPLMKKDTVNGLGLLCDDCNAFSERS